MAAINRSRVTTTSSDSTSVGSGTNAGYGLFGKRRIGNQLDPTILSLVVMLILEFAAYAALRYTFRSAHGG